MEQMNMTTFSYSKIEAVEKYDFDEVLPKMTNEKFVEHLTQMTDSQACLIYCKPDLAKSIRK